MPENHSDKPEIWFRIESMRFAPPLNEFDEPMGKGRLVLSIYRYRVVRHTPKGVWLDVAVGERWVRKEGHKRFACPTAIEAIESFRARKNRQIKILHAQLRDASESLYLLGSLTEAQINGPEPLTFW